MRLASRTFGLAPDHPALGDQKENAMGRAAFTTELPPRLPGILVADDMGLLLVLLKQELEPRGIAVWLAARGRDAVQQYAEHGSEIDLVLLDAELPELDGPGTLALLRRLDPGVRCCFLAGNADGYTEQDLYALGAECVFARPIRPAAVASALAGLLAGVAAVAVEPPRA
jgi:CheY-like chemotaxis protein